MLSAILGSLWLAGCATSSPETPATRQTEALEAYTQLGVAYLERNNLPRALNALDRALQIDARHGEALQALALVYQQQGETALAARYFEQALEAAPSSTRTRNNYAAFLYQQARYHDACEQLEIASRDAQYPNRAQLFTNLGQCYGALDEFERARDSFQRAQSIDPRQPRGYLLLAELEVSQGNYGQAWAPLKRYMALAEPTPATLEMAAEIAQARGDTATAADYRQMLNRDQRVP